MPARCGSTEKKVGRNAGIATAARTSRVPFMPDGIGSSQLRPRAISANGASSDRLRLSSIFQRPTDGIFWLLVRSPNRSEEHTSELQSLMRISYAVFCLKKKNYTTSNL